MDSMSREPIDSPTGSTRGYADPSHHLDFNTLPLTFGLDLTRFWRRRPARGVKYRVRIAQSGAVRSAANYGNEPMVGHLHRGAGLGRMLLRCDFVSPFCNTSRWREMFMLDDGADASGNDCIGKMTKKTAGEMKNEGIGQVGDYGIRIFEGLTNSWLDHSRPGEACIRLPGGRRHAGTWEVGWDRWPRTAHICKATATTGTTGTLLVQGIGAVWSSAGGRCNNIPTVHKTGLGALRR